MNLENNVEKSDQLSFNNKIGAVIAFIVAINTCLSIDNYFLTLNSAEQALLVVWIFMAVIVQFGAGLSVLVLYFNKNYKGIIITNLLVILVMLLIAGTGYYEYILGWLELT